MGAPEVCVVVPTYNEAENIADAILEIGKSVLDGKDGVVGRRFAFGTGVGYTTRETAELIKELINPGATLHWWSHARPAESSRIVISKEAITKAKEVLGWYPKYDLQSGIKQAINEWREVLGV